MAPSSIPPSRVEISDLFDRYSRDLYLRFRVHVYVDDELVTYSDYPTYHIAFSNAQDTAKAHALGAPLPVIDLIRK